MKEHPKFSKIAKLVAKYCKISLANLAIFVYFRITRGKKYPVRKKCIMFSALIFRLFMSFVDDKCSLAIEPVNRRNGLMSLLYISEATCS